MMEVLELTVPLLLAGAALLGLWRRVDVYDALLAGAADGLGVLIRIVPALIALLTAVWMLRASGALELLAGLLAPDPAGNGSPAAGAACERQRRSGSRG